MYWEQIYNSAELTRHIFNQRLLQKKGLSQNVLDLFDPVKPIVLIIDANCTHFVKNIEEYTLVHYVRNEPNIPEIKELLKKLPNVSINLVGIGGGSSLDFAKALMAYRLFPESHRVGYDHPRENFEIPTFKKNLDTLICIPTTVSSGSEASRYALIYFNEIKMPIRNWNIVPSLVIHDSELLSPFKKEQLIYQHFDTFVHALEVFYCKNESSYIAKSLVKPTLDEVRDIIDNSISSNVEKEKLITNLQTKAFLAGNAISNVRTGALHTVGESLASCFKNLNHIDSLYFASKNYKLLTKKFQRQNKLFKRDLDNLNYYRDKISTLISDNKDLEQVGDYEKFLNLVLSDKVLWNKEHFSEIQEDELLNYLQQTWSTLNKKL